MCFYSLGPTVETLRTLFAKPPEHLIERLPSTDNRVDKFILWIAQQCYGLVGGLCTIHESEREEDDRYGIHGDIKPGNILYFSPEKGPRELGSLKIFVTMRRGH